MHRTRLSTFSARSSHGSLRRLLRSLLGADRRKRGHDQHQVGHERSHIQLALVGGARPPQSRLTPDSAARDLSAVAGLHFLPRTDSEVVARWARARVSGPPQCLIGRMMNLENYSSPKSSRTTAPQSVTAGSARSKGSSAIVKPNLVHSSTKRRSDASRSLVPCSSSNAPG